MTFFVLVVMLRLLTDNVLSVDFGAGDGCSFAFCQGNKQCNVKIIANKLNFVVI